MIVILMQIAGEVALLLAVMVVLGAPAASFLPSEIPIRARWALAPALGLAISICLLTSLNWFLPGRVAAFVGLLPALVVALAIAWRRRSALWSPGLPKQWLAPVLMVGFVVVAFASPLAYQHSLGPGGFQVWDGPNYASAQTGLVYNAVTDKNWGPAWSVMARNGEFFIPSNPLHQQVGFDSVAATIDGGVGIAPIQTQVPFMIAIVAIGALAAYGAFVVLLGGYWAALIAGLFYAGPVSLQLVIDGSEGAIVGIAHMFPMLLLGLLALRGRGRVVAALFCIVAASAAVSYPVLFPGWAAAAGLIWLITVATRVLHKPGSRASYALRAVGGGLLVLAGTAAAAPFAFARTLGYWKQLIDGGGVVAGLPGFDLPLPVLPSYVLGTREFYFLPHISDINVNQWLLADVLPLGMLGLIAVGLVWWRRALWPLLPLAGVLLFITAGVSGSDCSYCVQRSLLPLGPLAGFALTAGGVALAAFRFRGARAVGVLVTLGLLALVWHTNWTLMRRGAHGAYFVPQAEMRLVGDVAKQPAPILIEGFAGNYDAPAELPTTLLAAGGGGYRPHGPKLSILLQTNDYSGLAYIGGVKGIGPEFDPNYRTVATRLAAIRTARTTIKRVGGVALQRRTQPYDITLDSGFFVNRARAGDQRVFVNGPLSLAVVGPPGRDVAVRLEIRDLRERLKKLPRRSVVRVRGGLTTVCVPIVNQRQTLRRVGLNMGPTNLAGLQLLGWYANHPTALGGPYVEAMRVVTRCGRR